MQSVSMRIAWLPAVVVMALCSLAKAEERNAIRVLYDFEDGADNAPVQDLLQGANGGIEITYSREHGVTQGKKAARFRIPAGQNIEFFLGSKAIKNWSDFDYFAMDIFTEESDPIVINFELWDALTKGYPTRATMALSTHAGQQTILTPIRHAKRNNKEGRDWDELEPQDKMNLDGLTSVKFFLSAPKQRDLLFWVDNIRLMQEDAAKPKINAALPDGAIAFEFGGVGATGFKPVPVNRAFNDAQGFGFVSTQGLKDWNKGWPDPLSGTFITGTEGQSVEFRAKVPNGDYSVWLVAGKIIHPAMNDHHYLLKLNDKALCDENPSPEEYAGENYLYRFMSTQYSERPNALWNDFIDRMFPTQTLTVKIENGLLKLSAINHFLSAIVLIPAAKKADFETMTKRLKELRIAEFYKTFYSKPQPPKPQARGKDTSVLLFAPDEGAKVMPWSGPGDERSELIGAGCPGERLVMRLAVVPFADLGKCELLLSDLNGPGTFSKDNITGYFENYISNGAAISGSTLLPTLTLNIEKGVTWCYWLWVKIPENTKPGSYQGKFVFRPEKGKPVDVPVSLEVYNLKLTPSVPASFGLYYDDHRTPEFPAAVRRQKMKEQFEWMREIGMTGVTIPGPKVLGVESGKVNLEFDPTLLDLAKEVGMGRNREQRTIILGLEVARAIARRLPGLEGAKVDQDPGIELKHQQFKPCFMDTMRQYHDYFGKSGLPIVVNPVDEPREIKNPWNRNLDETNQYCDMIHEVQDLPTYVDVISDESMGKDYTPLVDHCYIIATQAATYSEKFIRKTVEKNKTLWIYNSNCSRIAWGFHLWRVKARGMWQWHFCAPAFNEENLARYPGLEWYNPFTDLLPGFAGSAPTKYRGGMLITPLGLTVSQGINDYNYLYTLQEAIDANQRAGKNARAVEAGRAFMAMLEREIPLALTGSESANQAATECDRKTPEWRKSMARLLQDLQQ